MKVLFLINSSRRQGHPTPELVRELEALLSQSEVEYRMELTESMDQALGLLGSAPIDAYDQLWIGGGDGTINQLLNATYPINPDMVYGVVPMGTVNALARSLGIPSDPVAAVHYLLEASPTPIDIVRVNERYFLCYASVGLHAAIMHHIDPGLKKRLGRFAFFVSGSKAVLQRGRLPRFQVEFVPLKPEPSPFARDLAPAETDGEKLHLTGQTMILSNICNFAGFGVVRNDPCSSRFLELHLFEKNRLVPMLKWLYELRFGAGPFHAPTSGIALYKLSHCTLHSDEPLLVQVDGEPVQPADSRHLEFQCLPAAVRVLLKQTP